MGLKHNILRRTLLLLVLVFACRFVLGWKAVAPSPASGMTPILQAPLVPPPLPLIVSAGAAIAGATRHPQASLHAANNTTRQTLNRRGATQKKARPRGATNRGAQMRGATKSKAAKRMVAVPV